MDRLGPRRTPARPRDDGICRARHALRKNYPVLRETRFLFGDREVLPGLYDVSWFDERGDALAIEAWQDPEGRALTLRRAGPGLNGETEVFLMMFNAIVAGAAFTPPAPHLEWNVLLDSAEPEARTRPLVGSEMEVAAHSIVVMLARADRRRRLAGGLDGGRASGAASFDCAAARSRQRCRRTATRRRRRDSPHRRTPTGRASNRDSNRMAEIMSECPIDPHTHHYAYCLPFGAHLTGAVRENAAHALSFLGAVARKVQVEIERAGAAPDAHRHGAGGRRLVRSRSRWRRGTLLSLSAGRRHSRCPIPASRFQPEDVHGPSEVVDPRAYRWTHTDWHGRPWEETVLYELHVGAMGGYAGVHAAPAGSSRSSA